MSIPTAVQQLIETEEKRGLGVFDPEKTLAIALSRVGGFEASSGEKGQIIVAGTLSELLNHPPEAFGEPLHSLVLVGKRLHHLEVEYAEEFSINRQRWRDVATAVYGCSLD
jgi:diphthine methyl ester synthase